jgi:hypothetical protein
MAGLDVAGNKSTASALAILAKSRRKRLSSEETLGT